MKYLHLFVSLPKEVTGSCHRGNNRKACLRKSARDAPLSRAAVCVDVQPGPRESQAQTSCVGKRVGCVGGAETVRLKLSE